MMKDFDVSFATARLLRDSGFDYDGDLWYTPDGELDYNDATLLEDLGITDLYPAPSQSEVCRWLMEEHGLYVSVLFDRGMAKAEGRGFAPRIFNYRGAPSTISGTTVDGVPLRELNRQAKD